ncbi:MAG: efflux RND transporter periplasmic adaptor subunit, partial [Candidatus Zixiibacteriota bacterium]
ADFDPARADLDIAEAELTQAQNNFTRRDKLFNKGLISREELDETELSLKRAKGKLVRVRIGLDQAQVRLDETEVLAPIDGVILQKLVEAGQIITSGVNNIGGGAAIAAIADMRRVYVEAGIDEIDVGKVHIGQEALVVADAYPRRKFSGTIIRISPEAKIEQNVTQFDVVVEVENEDGRLKSGMNASMEITIIEKDNALLAPAMALTQLGQGGNNGHGSRGGWSGPGRSGAHGAQGGYAGNRNSAGRAGSAGSAGSGGRGRGSARTVLVKENGEFVTREVQVGMSDFKQAVIISGLREGDTLGVQMISRLKQENDRLEQRIKSARSFGTSSSSGSSGKRAGK